MWPLDQDVQDATAELKQLQAGVAEQENRLRQMKSQMRKQQQALTQKQEQLNNHQLMLDTARHHQAVQVQQNRAMAVADNGYGQPSVAEQGILARHREGGAVGQARQYPAGKLPAAGLVLPEAVTERQRTGRDARKQLEDFKMYWLSTR